MVGIVWFPLVLMTGAGLYLLGPYFRGLRDAANAGDTLFAYGVQGNLVLFYAAVYLGFSMIAVGVVQFAFGTLKAPVRIYFSLGLSVWRMLAAWIAASVVMGLLVGLLVTLALILARIPGMPAATIIWAPDWTAYWLAATVIIAFVLFFYAWIRLTFLLPAVVVAERTVGLVRSWQLSHRSFWRMFALSVAAVLPLYALFMLFAPLLAGLALIAMGQKNPGDAVVFAKYLDLLTNLPLSLALTVPLAIFAAHGYRALVAPPSAPVTSAAAA